MFSRASVMLVGFALLGGPVVRANAEQTRPNSAGTDGSDAVVPRGARLEIPIASIGNHWALIIGVNYAARQDDLSSAADRSVVPPLRNAVKDAEVMKDVLTTYYNYDAKRLTLLTEEEANHEAIVSALTKLCDPAQVGADDSVLVFFSGHGVRLSGATGKMVAILPNDVQIADGKPYGRFIRLHEDLFDTLKRSPARHKLAILDSCYSGDIFHRNFQPRSNSDDRSDPQLQLHQSFQAMASCRATQVASDGADGHSPFTAALIEGLRRIPAQRPTDRVQANRLLAYIRPHFDMRNEQTPDCRSLVDSDGEFCFFPGAPSLFDRFRVAASEEDLLRAMIASRQGNWWFHEMPWFIPGVREQFIRTYQETLERPRSQRPATYIDSSVLKDAADVALSKLEQHGLREAQRAAHSRALRDSHNTNDFTESLERIADELEARVADLEAVDVHLLALAQHALGRYEQARATYDRALQKYIEGRSRDKPMDDILEALCRADLGELLLENLLEANNAAEQFRIAGERIASLAVNTTQQEAAAVFLVFIHCREADAWLKQNRWSEANKRLVKAHDRSWNLGTTEYLSAHVHRRRAWAEMMQWKIDDAECSFRRSNEILATRMAIPEVRSSNDDDRESGVHDVTHSTACPGGASPFVITVGIRNSKEFAEKLAYLHNLHGIAMARRFKGNTGSAIDGYRWLVREVGDALHQLAEANADPNTEKQFVERFINTQERLGDCNLFGDPASRDITEAVDDYRRAMANVHLLRGIQRKQWQTRLLYKQALALAQPSRIQDSALALEMCRRADELYRELMPTATGLEVALGRLATPVVEVIVSGLGRDSGGAADQIAVSKLRNAILAFRDDIGRSPHRDQLELCLFASAVLLEHVGDHERLQLIEDCDLLLSFCRTALAQQRDSNDARAYLRPYYDAAMRVRLQVAENRVKELLEIHWEATQGVVYIKQERLLPIVAVYSLDGEPLLLVDLPWGASRCVSLAEHYDAETLRQGAVQPQPLPSDIQRVMAEWARSSQEQGKEIGVAFWLDGECFKSSMFRGSHYRDPRGTGDDDIPADALRLFEAPAGFKWLPEGTGPSPAKSDPAVLGEWQRSGDADFN